MSLVRVQSEEPNLRSLLSSRLFAFFASLTLTQHRIQPGKHLVDNDVRYAFQTLAFPYRLPTPRVSSVNAPQLSLKKRLPVG